MLPNLFAAEKKLTLDKFISSNKGKTTLFFRKQMAQKVFETTAAYDSSIASWFANNKQNVPKIANLNSVSLRYGENPNQKSKYYFTSKINLIEQAKIKGTPGLKNWVQELSQQAVVKVQYLIMF